MDCDLALTRSHLVLWVALALTRSHVVDRVALALLGLALILSRLWRARP